MMQNNKLLPCPFCGSEPRFRIYDLKDYKGNHEYIIRCDKCNIQFRENDIYTTTFIAKQEVVDRWNTRKPMERIVEQLKEELKRADEEKRRCVIENPMQFDIVKGYSTGMSNALDIVKGGVDNAE